MFETVKNILVSLTEEGRNESTAALAFALSLAEKADAHLTVHAASLRLKLPSAMVSRMAAKLVAEENRGSRCWLSVSLLRHSEKQGCRGYHVQLRFLIWHMPTY
jgi:hypothetical protein